MPRPRGGDWLADEVESWRLASVDVVVSLLTPDEVSDLGLAEEAAVCQSHGVEFLSFPLADRSIPSSTEAVLELAGRLANFLAAGKSVAIHCRQGIGRAALIAASVLVMLGLDPETAVQRLSAARGCPVPETSEQKRWIIKFGESVLATPTK
jgi:protein-tyrosine phosphatase